MKTLMALKACVVAAVAACAFASANAKTCTWTGAGSDGNASTAENWSDNAAPETGDDIVLDATGADKPMTWDLWEVSPGSWTQKADYTETVTISTTFDESQHPVFAVSGDVAINGGGWTHARSPNPPAGKKGDGTYRLKVNVGGSFTLGAAAKIDLFGKGLGAGQGFMDGGGERGASYGGRGKGNNSPCYGSVKHPYHVAAGGSANYGGGCLMLTVAGAATIDGEIVATGSRTTIRNNTGEAYGAAGGTIAITAATISGVGTINANSGDLYIDWNYHSPAGGGRISLIQTAAGATYDTLPANVTAYSGNGYNSDGVTYSNPNTTYSGAGTIYYEVPSDDGRGKLILKNRFANAFAYDQFYTTEFNADYMDQDLDFHEIEISHGATMRILGGAITDLKNTVFTGDGDGRLVVDADLDLGEDWTWGNVRVYPLKGANVYGTKSTTFRCEVVYEDASHVPGDLILAAGANVTHRKASSTTSGYRIDLTIDGDLTVDEGAAVDATAKGYDVAGFGTDKYWVGSGHGGRGSPNGPNKTTAAPCYGDVREPITCGSNGDHSNGGGVTAPGGRVKLTVGGTATVNGMIASTASTGGAYQSPSAGSVQLTAAALLGSGQITAIGAPSGGNSCSGGGRIAVTLTGENATFDDFAGDIVAFGRGNSSRVTYILEPDTTKETRSGAGTIYLREKNAALDEGTLYADQRRDDGKVNVYAITELCASTTGRDYGAIVITNDAILAINDVIDVTASRWENHATMNVSDASTCHVKGDADGNAYLIGDMTFTTLVFDESVKTVYIGAGDEVTVTKVLSLVGAADRVIKIRSTVDGEAAALTVREGALAEVKYVDVKDCDATGGVRIDATQSTSQDAPGWNCINIVPGSTITWKGTTAAWSTGSNWDLDRAPVATDLVVIPAGCDAYPVLPAAETVVSNLTVEAGASLALSGFPLTVTGDASILGSFAATGSETLTLCGNVVFNPQTPFDPLATTVVLGGESAATLALSGKTFHKLVFARTGVTAVTGGATAFETRVEAGADLSFEAGKTLTTTLLYVSGSPTAPVSFASTVAGSAWNLVVSGYAVLSDVRATDSDASAGSKIFAGGASSGDACVNWVFEDARCNWTGAASDDFADAANWVVKGEVPNVAPGADDYIVIDASGAAHNPVVKAEQSITSFTVVSGDFRVNAALEVSGSATVMDGGKLIADKPVVIGGSFSMLSGATLTHTALPSSDDKDGESHRIDLTVGGDMTVQKGASVDVRSKGYAAYKGPGAFYSSYWLAFHGGGVRLFAGGVPPNMCYGSIFAPTNAGTGSHVNGSGPGVPYVGGGAVGLTVAGLLTLDDDILTQPTGCWDWFGGAGGSVYIRAGALRGSGNIDVSGGWGAQGCAGGGGRVSVVLTGADSDFADYHGQITSYGGSIDIDKATMLDSKKTESAGGTIYTKTAGDALGTIFVENQVTLKEDNGKAYTDLGYDAASSNLSGASLKLGRNARVRLMSNVTIGSIESIAPTARLYLNGFTLKVRTVKDKEIDALVGTRILLEGTEDAPGQLRWKPQGMALIVR